MTAQVHEGSPAADDDLSPWRQAGLETRQRRRRLLLGVLVAFAVFSVLTGFPTGRETITFWLLITLLAACGGEVRVWWRAVVRDWLPLLLVLIAYDLLRGLANEIGGTLFGLTSYRSSLDVVSSTAQAHMTEPIALDRLMFGGEVPTLWLQERFHDVGVAHWWDKVALPIYLSHFLVSLGVAIVLWCLNYRLFRAYLATLVTLTLITLATYVLYPAAPPWMAALNNQFGPGVGVERVVQNTLGVLGGETFNSVVEKGAAYSNPVAAMPSLHAAIPMMLLLFFWSEVRTRGRTLLALYTLLMALTLVYGGEHYVVDVLLGWIYAAVAVLGVKILGSFRPWRTATAESEPLPALAEAPAHR